MCALDTSCSAPGAEPGRSTHEWPGLLAVCCGRCMESGGIGRDVERLSRTIGTEKVFGPAQGSSPGFGKVKPRETCTGTSAASRCSDTRRGFEELEELCPGARLARRPEG